MVSVIARFENAGALLRAVGAAREAGYRRLDAFAPFPVPGLPEALGFRERRIPAVALLAGLIAAAGTYFMQWYSGVIDYPFVVGGKPLHSWPAFLVTTYSLGILTAVITAFVAMLVGNRLPRPHHPVFDWPEFDRASADGFFLLVDDGERGRATAFLREHGAADIRELP